MLRLNKLFVFFFFSFIITATSQFKDKSTLLTIDGEPVYMEEFLRVYNKNLEMVQDEGQKDKKAYLDLFINYKIKTKEAISQGLDKSPEFLSEFSGYEEQLSQNYLYEQEITEALIKEAYDRLQEEVNANHILIRLAPDAKPEDTLVAYNKIREIWKKAKKGDDFVALAKAYSEEPNAAERAGALGYFKGFGMVYSFENAAYNTPVGEVSGILRTQFGYHILKVNDRRVVPEEVTVAHIMISTRKELTDEQAKNRIDELYKKVNQGENFEDLAKQFSEDPGTANKGGVLARFGSGKLNSPEFEQSAFKLNKPGDVSEPVKTEFGWHIIKLLERHPKKSFEESKEDILKRIKSTDRSKIIIQSVHDRIKEKYGFTKDENPLPFFNNFVTDSVLKRKWEYIPGNPALRNTLFKIGQQEYHYADFAAYIAKRQKHSRVYEDKERLLKNFYTEFEEEKLKEFFKQNLETENEEYASLLAEYRDGLLIYDLMNQNIWEPSKKDTVGLLNFFEANRNNYRWEARVCGVIASTANKNTANQIKKMLEENIPQEDIKTRLNTEEKIQVIFTEGLFELGNSVLPTDFKPREGVSEVFPISADKNNTNTSQFIVVNVNEVLPAKTKELDEIKGKVINDYQNYLEAQWMNELREKYHVKVNKKAMK